MKIKAYFFRKLLALILIPALLAPAYAAIPANALCTPKGYTLGFFNGVWNTKFEADNGRDALRNLLTDSYNSENVKYETFYNYSGKNPGSGATMMQDVAEVLFNARAKSTPAAKWATDLSISGTIFLGTNRSPIKSAIFCRPPP
ncbi:hypothetical protein BA896_004670 [Janthinobacterium lividum]|uniref:Uncharacterized protein n=1 Tax=Janthinobacterium lividum TaxID=29581 RepID=A0A1E8PRV2_9BURK|nr:hypothetical protein BA896_004670 [Janthinobacterium lividum]